MDTMKIGGRCFPITSYAVRESTGEVVPLVDIPMMSDYQWHLRGLRDRLEHPERYRAIGEDVEEVVAQLQEWLEEHSEGVMA